MKRWPLPFAMALLLAATTTEAEQFNAPALSGFSPTPSSWSFLGPDGTLGYGVMFNLSTVSRELVLPLPTENLTNTGQNLNWSVYVDVGGTLLPTDVVVCTLYLIGAGMIASRSTQQVYTTPPSGPATGTLHLVSPAATPCSADFVDCSVAKSGWVGNVLWTVTP